MRTRWINSPCQSTHWSVIAFHGEFPVSYRNAWTDGPLIATRVVPVLIRHPDARDVRCLAGEPQNELLYPAAGDPTLRTTLPCLRGVCA